MPLRCNLEADEGFRKDAQQMVRDQIRPVIHQELKDHLSKEMVQRELVKAIEDMKANITRNIKHEVIHALRYDSAFTQDIAKQSQEWLDKKAEAMNMPLVERLVTEILRKKLGGVL